MIKYPASPNLQTNGTCSWKIQIDGLFYLSFPVFDLNCTYEWIRIGNKEKFCQKPDLLTSYGPTNLTYYVGGQESNATYTGFVVKILPVDGKWFLKGII